MGTRELLILILGLAVVAVILRGLYVAIHARRRQIRLAIDKNIPQDLDLEELEMSELPSGGARVVRRSLARVNRQNSLQNELDLGVDSGAREQAVPILLDSVELRKEPQHQGAEGKPAWTVREKRDPEFGEIESEAFETGVEEQFESPANDQDAVADSDLDEALADDDGNRVAADSPRSVAPATRAGDWGDEEEDDLTDSDEQQDDADWQEDGARQESGFDPDEAFDDEFGDFSLTAGDRIGAPESEIDSGAEDEPTTAPGSDRRKGSLFSRLGRKESNHTDTRTADRGNNGPRAGDNNDTVPFTDEQDDLQQTHREGSDNSSASDGRPELETATNQVTKSSRREAAG